MENEMENEMENKMEKRHSLPLATDCESRPSTRRKRSYSLPIVDAFGCSTPEAELILAEGRAAVRRRQASTQNRTRRRPSPLKEDVYRPRYHLQYLNNDSAVFSNPNKEPTSPSNSTPTSARHSRIPSNTTDSSTSTVTSSAEPRAEEASVVATSPGSPLEEYSATLAQFIKSQLKSIPTYQTARTSLSPHSCPDLTHRPSTPPKSPTKSKRPMGVHSIVEIPPIRPPLQSQFSAWSSTDDEIDESDNEVPPLPNINNSRHQTPTSNSNYTPSILNFYENSNGSTFLFTSTPVDEGAMADEGEDPLTAKASQFPDQSTLPGAASPAHSPTQQKIDYPSSAPSTHPQLSSSSVPSLSSTSTASYFDCKRSMALAPDVRARIIAAVTPNNKAKHITAVSPFEGDDFASVHDILVESQQRVLVDGLSFDMLRDFNIPEDGMMRVPTPC